MKKVKYNGEWFEVLDSWGSKVSFWYGNEVITVTLSELDDYK